ncbi:MAG: hypothetical protein DBX44_03455 [Oscillospiraceae bacterium]|nr:MAG: hypothetical protein DBX44_03455 [Oscillospiraceae bacterium]
MKKRCGICAAACLMLLLAAGCARESGDSANSPSLQPAVSESVASEASAAGSSDLIPDGQLEVYRYWPGGKVYTCMSLPLHGEGSLLTVVNLAASVLPDCKEDLPIRKITQEEALVTIDWEPAFLSDFSKGDQEEILTTVAMTLLQNGIADAVAYTLDGETGLFGERWTPAPLSIVPSDPAQWEAICASIDYPGLAPLSFPTAEQLEERFGVQMDETAMEIARLLARVGRIEEDASSPLALPPGRLAYHCIRSTSPMSIEEGATGYQPALVPIADSVSAKLGMQETMFWLEAHLQETARILLGDEFLLDLNAAEEFGYRYFPEEGVVTPPHMGGGYNAIPLVLSYEETADGYTAEVVYLFETPAGIGEWGMEHPVSEQELPAYVTGEAPRASVTICRAADGRLCFGSYTLQ